MQGQSEVLKEASVANGCAAIAAGFQQRSSGAWLAALAAAWVPLRQLRLYDGAMLPGELVGGSPPDWLVLLCTCNGTVPPLQPMCQMFMDHC
jgi:hypothetical protein